MPTNLIGQVLLAQFRVDEFVASGGMGAVYRVWDLKRNVSLAMKILHADLADDPSIFKRFKREANALRKLTHPNIVPFYGLYETMDFSFLLEHFVDGPTLKEILAQRKGKPLPIREALIILKALCAALGYAHANGVVHCDVKPGNVLVDRGGRIYLTDFGVARHAESTTTTFGVAGTPAYMTPEQIRGEQVTPATDVYSLGVILFEMLTGQRPFRGTDQSTEKVGSTANERIRYEHLHRPPPDLRSLNSAVPLGIANAILKALSKRPIDRYRSARDFFEAICSVVGMRAENVADQLGLPAGTQASRDNIPRVAVAPPPAKASGPIGTREPFEGKQSNLARGNLAPAIMLGAALLMIAVAIFAAGRDGNGDIPLTGPSPVTETIPSSPASYPTSPPDTSWPSAPPQPTSGPSPTDAPVVQEPSLYLQQENSFCRIAPRVDANDIGSLPGGKRLSIIGMDSHGWWLVKLDEALGGSDRKACWIYEGNNIVEGDISAVVNREDFEVPRNWLP